MITAIVDLQFGSTGKGLLAGYLSQQEDFDVVVSANMPNAGHTFVDELGRKWVHKVLPSGVYSKNLGVIAVGPGAVFDVDQLAKEIGYLQQQGIPARVVVHEAAGILLPRHAEAERAGLNHIASTMQGSMEAVVEKMRRASDANVAANHAAYIEQQTGAIVITATKWLHMMDNANSILVEGSQGYSLGINAGFYPNCTSRDCTVWRLLADCGVVVKGKLRVIGTARVHPIRVGNTQGGWSGGHYPDQDETTWEELGQTPETTTVTGRIRRVFTFSMTQIVEAVKMNRVDQIFLNFCNYDPRQANKIKQEIDAVAVGIMEDRGFPTHMTGFEDKFPMVKWMGFGPRASDVIEVNPHDY